MIEIFIKASSARWLKASLINMKRKAINTHYYTIRIQMFTVCTTPPPVKKLGAVQRLKPAKSNIYARRVAGLFFCLASAEGAGLLFCPVAICFPIQAFTAHFVPSVQFIPPTPQNSAQGFTVAFLAIAPAQPPQIPDRHKRL
jgi:hypothetical protein